MDSDTMVPTFSASDNARKAVWVWWFEVSLKMIQSADFVKYTCPNDGDGIFVAINVHYLVRAPPVQSTVVSKTIVCVAVPPAGRGVAHYWQIQSEAGNIQPVSARTAKSG